MKRNTIRVGRQMIQVETLAHGIEVSVLDANAVPVPGSRWIVDNVKAAQALVGGTSESVAGNLAVEELWR